MATDNLCQEFAKSFPHGFLNKYTPIKGIQEGNNTLLIAATNLNTRQAVVLKLYRRLFLDHRKALCALRDIKYMSQLNHPNITRMHNVAGKQRLYFTDVFIEMERNSVNLDRALTLDTVFFPHEADKIRCIRQILMGLAYMHSAQLVHRNLQPKHILGNSVCYKIADFNHARKIGVDSNDDLTRPITKSNYSAPELILCPQRLTTACDIYSAGLICIQVFDLSTTPFLPNRSGVGHIREIFKKTGRPLDEDLCDLNEEGRDMIRNVISDRPHKTWEEALPEFSLDAIDLLEGMLQFAGSRRFTAVQALERDIFEDLNHLPLNTNYRGLPLEDYDSGITLPAILAKIREVITVDLSTESDTDQARPLGEEVLPHSMETV